MKKSLIHVKKIWGYNFFGTDRQMGGQSLALSCVSVTKKRTGGLGLMSRVAHNQKQSNFLKIGGEKFLLKWMYIVVP